MTIRTTLFAVGALAAATLAASPAAAAVTLYSFSGTFQNGWALEGSFNYDDAAASNARASDATLTIDGQHIRIDSLSEIYNAKFSANLFKFSSTQTYRIGGVDLGDLSLTVGMIGSASPDGVFTGAKSGRFNSGSLSYTPLADSSFAFSNLSSSTITAGAVPEPASWALMLAGFGLAGAALRRRQRPQVAFA